MKPSETGDWPRSDEVVSRLRAWLDETAERSEMPIEPDEDSPSSDGSAGLYQVVERLTAVRHELKLLTKVLRRDEERHEATLLSMQAATEKMHAAGASEPGEVGSDPRSLVEALIDMDQALWRGHQVITNARRRVLAEAGDELRRLRESFEQLYRSQPWWRRLLCRRWHAALQDIHGPRSLNSCREIHDSLLEGFELIQARLKRAFEEHDIIRMDCVGRQANPHCMTVVEVVGDPAQPSGTVVEELRPGYFWKKKVFRFAEVKTVGET